MSLVSDLEGLSLSLDDCRCPVCLEIFMEPVTLPCSHTFCKVCFLESVDKATLCCPLCRKRVSSWARLHSRKNSMVDQKLWSRIQSSFPLQCERRIRGEEEEPGVSVFFPRVCLPGELKQEYEDQVSRLTEEKLLLEEEESRQSEELISRLLQEEQLELQEERKRREEDGRLALLLSTQLNPAPAAVSAAKKRKKTEVSGGQMERFLCPLPAQSSSSDGCFMSDKENILLCDAALQEERLEGFLCPSDEEQRESRFHADAGPSSSKRKISERSEDKDLTAPKRGCPSPFSPTVDLTGWESRQQQQEEDDRRLALMLQKELDQEERQRASDRRKGSADPYLLRQNRGSTKTSSTKTSSTKTSSRGSTKTSSCPETSSTKTSSTKTSSRGSTKTSSCPETSSRGSPETSSSAETSSRGSPETSSRGSPETSSSAETPSSKTSSSRRSKQATLMEMFSLSS